MVVSSLTWQFPQAFLIDTTRLFFRLHKSCSSEEEEVPTPQRRIWDAETPRTSRMPGMYHQFTLEFTLVFTLVNEETAIVTPILQPLSHAFSGDFGPTAGCSLRCKPRMTMSTASQAEP